MESMVDSGRAGGEHVAETLGETVEIAALSDDDLIARLAEPGLQRCRIERLLAEAAAEMHRRDGSRARRR